MFHVVVNPIGAENHSLQPVCMGGAGIQPRIGIEKIRHITVFRHLTDARDQLRTVVVRSQAGERGKQRHQQGVGDQAQRGLNQQIGVSKARRRSCDAKSSS